ncbi:hypothetical protein HNP37_001155 [Flavobacterium nitrogenifigens]|uniref:Uncharacterized protein n=2 Tax=Flavobacterium TaxID=237 RepID=A0A7W7IV25_9FLAO|nr:hypothetical protein [Flavobacterium nitrogenifigens]MBB6385136.1 hypothetical protein [Flavobacterium notoginsengisoli]
MYNRLNVILFYRIVLNKLTVKRLTKFYQSFSDFLGLPFTFCALTLS